MESERPETKVFNVKLYLLTEVSQTSFREDIFLNLTEGFNDFLTVKVVMTYSNCYIENRSECSITQGVYTNRGANSWVILDLIKRFITI